MSIFGRKKEDAADTSPEAAGVPTQRDSELAMPTYRAPAANSTPMGMPPKPGNAPVRPGVPAPSAMAGRTPATTNTTDRRTLIVGRGISLQGTVADAERLVVEGTVDSQMIQAAELSVAQTGVFKGEVQVEDAEIAGLFDGTVTARGSLTIRSTGTVKGVARYKKLTVEEGGKIMGTMEMLQGEG